MNYLDGSKQGLSSSPRFPFVQTTKLHYRGARIWQAVMDDLLAKGMDKAENV